MCAVYIYSMGHLVYWVGSLYSYKVEPNLLFISGDILTEEKKTSLLENLLVCLCIFMNGYAFVIGLVTAMWSLHCM